MSRRKFVFFTAIGLAAAVCLLAAGAPDLSIRVVVRGQDGELVPRAYVALVPPYRPWSKPLFESVVEGGTAIFRVPPGSYRVVAAANGFGPKTIGPFPVAKDSRNEFTVRLSESKLVTGTVSDSNGSPVAGARVATAPAFIPAPLGRFSELAMKTLADGWSATSDENGSWKLPLPTDAATPLVIEKDGYSAAWVLFHPSDPVPIDVFLKRGAALHLTLDRADPSLTVTLRRQGNPSADSIPPDWEAVIHAQRPANELISWNSLPPGDYELLTKFSDVRSFGGKAKRLAALSLTPGETRSMRVALPPPAPRPAEVGQLFLPNIADDELADIAAFGSDKGGESVQVPTALEDTTGGTVVYINADRARPPYYAVTSSRFITAARDSAEKASVPAEAAVHSRADVNLHIRSADKELSLPRGGSALFAGCEHAPRVAMSVSVLTDGLVRLPAPAGCKSVVFEFDPFEPVVSTAVIRPVEVKALGDFSLKAAGSADIHVVRDPGNAPIGDASVRVVTTSEQGDSVVLTQVNTSSDGWAHATTLPTKRELRAVALTREGDASLPARFMVDPRGRAKIDPLSIAQPSSLVIEPKIDAEFHRQFPDAVISEIHLDSKDDERLAEHRIMKLEGRESVTVDRVRPGKWRLMAVIRTGNAFDPIDLDDVDVPAAKSMTITPLVSPLVFQGRVLSHGNGVEGKVDIGGPRHAPSSIIRSITTAADGSFRVLLPARGRYDVSVRRAAAQELFIPIGEVEFNEPASPV